MSDKQQHEVGSYFRDSSVGFFLVQTLRDEFPDAKIDLGDKFDQDIHFKTILMTTSDADIERARAFCRGYFTAYNNRRKFA